jgi:hypothetical protein
MWCMNYEVIEEHRSNYPNPITIRKDTKLKLGNKYSGTENWDNWRYCYTLDNGAEGWVPEQLLIVENEYGVILEDYTAKELNVEKGEIVKGMGELNGWLWCIKIIDEDEGWLPKDKLRII